MIHEVSSLRGRVQVFRDRAHAGEILADLVAPAAPDTLVLGIPAGGVPVAAAMASRLGLVLDVAVVSKITPRWNSEVGFGAVAFDGTVEINPETVARFEMRDPELRERIEETSRKVEARVRRFREGRALPDVSRRPVVLVDDGLAGGFTMRVAIAALRKAGATWIAIAVPTGHAEGLDGIAREVEAAYCANVRAGPRFAVASAYEHWSDVSEDEAARILAVARRPA